MEEKSTKRFLPNPARVTGISTGLLLESFDQLEGFLQFLELTESMLNELQMEIISRFKKDALTFSQDMLLAEKDSGEIARRIRER
ncbi:hypothetical protein PTE30175_02535 [Pandoraea terrae]|uniref:Uncharacterized protein n=1 Tax=Pandoraea terrae TaxID=1537710 RepID=A0A5E4VG14_9BURK|nr:hypothetical protein [Pandoraea terrae]VVE10494.1 hypothetical protein PTE30175_02535 [Pandoraea terrae]